MTPTTAEEIWLAFLKAASMSMPLCRQAIRAPMWESPAPMVSATCAGTAGAVTRRPRPLPAFQAEGSRAISEYDHAVSRALPYLLRSLAHILTSGQNPALLLVDVENRVQA